MLRYINAHAKQESTLKRDYAAVTLPKIDMQEVTLQEAVTGLRVMAKNASQGKVSPNLIIKGPALVEKKLSLNLANVPLTGREIELNIRIVPGGVGTSYLHQQLKAGDRVIAVDGTPVFQRASISEHLAKNPARPTTFLVQRGSEQVTLNIQPRLDTDERTGKQVPRIGLRYRENIVVLHPTPWSQIGDDISSTFRTLGALISPSSDIGPSKLSGPIGIARALHQQAQWDIRRALWFVILVNVNLAIFNLLPIPVLDGGHLLFFLFEAVLRRPLPLRVRELASLAGLMILLALMGIAFKNDVERRWDVIQGQIKELVD